MAKDKQTRTYDQDGYRRRAACICVRDQNESEIMLVTSSRAPENWIVPGGGVEPNENPDQAATRETEEEAGVKGIIKRALGDIEVCDEFDDRKHRTSVFVLEVYEELDEYEDSKSRKRGWFSVPEALRLLAIYKPVQCRYVQLMIETSPSQFLRQLMSDCPAATSPQPSPSRSNLSQFSNHSDNETQATTSIPNNSEEDHHIGLDPTSAKSHISNFLKSSSKCEAMADNDSLLLSSSSPQSQQQPSSSSSSTTTTTTSSSSSLSLIKTASMLDHNQIRQTCDNFSSYENRTEPEHATES